MEISLEEVKNLVGAGAGAGALNPFHDMIGKNVFIRTVTYHYTGKVERIIGDFTELSKAAWVADSGRFTQAIEKEEFDEVEIYKNPIRINTTSIVDFTEISTLQESQK